MVLDWSVMVGNRSGPKLLPEQLAGFDAVGDKMML